MKNYEDYLGKKNKVPTQVCLDEDLREKIDIVLKKEGWTMRALVTGLLNKFLDEYKAKK